MIRLLLTECLHSTLHNSALHTGRFSTVHCRLYWTEAQCTEWVGRQARAPSILWDVKDRYVPEGGEYLKSIQPIFAFFTFPFAPSLSYLGRNVL